MHPGSLMKNSDGLSKPADHTINTTFSRICSERERNEGPKRNCPTILEIITILRLVLVPPRGRKRKKFFEIYTLIDEVLILYFEGY